VATLLSIVQDASVLLGFNEPTAGFTATDLTTKKLIKLANQAGRELMRYHDWQDLIVEQSFASLGTQEQTGALPAADYDRLAYNAIIWDTSAHLQLMGPTPQRYWRQIIAGISSGVSGYWRIVGGELNILPVVTAGNVLKFEYVSKRWVISAIGVLQDSFLADTDTVVAPRFADLLTLELIWRFRQSKGFGQYAEDMATCEREKEKAASYDRGSGRIRKEGNDYPASPIFPYVIGEA
jgi:hypothetical protein